MSLEARRARTRKAMMNKGCQGLMLYESECLLTVDMGAHAGLMMQSVYDALN